jgi:hypothetical protein
MKVELGTKGLDASFQDAFDDTCKCIHCKKGEARIAFVAHEMNEKPNSGKYVCNLHDNEGKGGFWLHDACAVAVYFCKECLMPTAIYNQA